MNLQRQLVESEAKHAAAQVGLEEVQAELEDMTHKAMTKMKELRDSWKKLTRGEEMKELMTLEETRGGKKDELSEQSSSLLTPWLG